MNNGSFQFSVLISLFLSLFAFFNTQPIYAQPGSDEKNGTPNAFKIPTPHIDTTKSPASSSDDEYYSARPDISSITAQDHAATLPRTWSSEREAHLEAVAQVFEMYPDRHIYFLARDGELLYDYAKTVLKDEPGALERIHLLNISRANMNDPNAIKYLAQEGISKENLEKGMKVLFVDTGYSGTIPKAISDKFPEDLRSRLQTHLMSSINPLHPSSRVFLKHFHKGTADINPSQMHSSIINYEHMPRFTYRAQTFKLHHGKWEPTGGKGKDSDGQVSQEKAKAYMEDLKFFALSQEGEEHWNARRDFWKNARQMLDSGQKDKLEVQLKALLNSNEKPMTRAMVRDLLELVSRNEPTKAELLPSYKTLGIPEIEPIDLTGTKLQVLKEHPEWKQILENPSTEIPKLVNGSDIDIQTLRNIIDEIDDYEIKGVIAKALYTAKDTHRKKAAETFESILNNKKHWETVLTNAFNAQAQTNPAIVAQVLKSEKLPIRAEAAESLGYYSGPEIHSLFEKALTDDSEDVRNAAISSLKYRNPSDQSTLQMLTKLLNHSKIEIRKEAASLIQLFYPDFQKKSKRESSFFWSSLRKSPFQSYVSSGCKAPINDVIHPNVVAGILDSILPTLNADIGQPSPIVRISKDDPRAKQAASFAKLGEIYQAAGLLWSGVAPKEMNYSDARKFCKKLGGRLPTDLEWLALGKALGNHVPARKYDPSFVPGILEREYWSSSDVPWNISTTPRFAFTGATGFIWPRGSHLPESVRCVRPVVW